MKRILVSIVCITLVITLLYLAGAPDEAAAQKDTLVVGMQDVSNSFDPALCYFPFCADILAHVYDRLVMYQGDDVTQPVPELAESWELMEDGKTWIFHLRKGATFAGGNPVNAAAVVFSLRRLVKFADYPAWVLTQFGITEDSISALDDETVQIVLADQYAPGLFLSCLPWFGILDPEIVLAHEQDDDLGSTWLEHHSAASGPYTIEEYRKKEHMVLAMNPHYWGEKPAFDRVIFRHVGESAEQAALVQTGEIDIAWNLSVDEIQRFENDPDVQILQTLGSNVVHLTMNMQHTPFTSPAVRDAIRYAIDYDGIIDYVLAGAALKQQSFLVKGLLGYTAGIPYTRDVEKAKHLLTEGGYPQGFEVELVCPEYPPMLELALKIKEDLAEIGLTVEVKPMTTQQLMKPLYARRDFQMYLWEWYYDYADPNSNAKVFAYCDSDDDDTSKKSVAWGAHYVIPDLTKLVEQAARERDSEQRKALYEQISRTVIDDGPFVFLYTPLRQYAVRTEVVDFIKSEYLISELHARFLR